MNGLHLWYKHTAHVSFLFNSTDSCYQNEWEKKSTSSRAIQVKNRWQTISTEEKLDVTSHLENKSLTHFHNVRFNHGSVCENANRINPLNAELNPICHLLALLGAHHILHVSRIRVKGSAKPGTKVFVCIAKLLQFYQNKLYKNCGCEGLKLLLHQK
jgi:hypothetical protein